MARLRQLIGRERRACVAWHGLVIAAASFVAFWKIGTPDAAGDERTYVLCGYRYISGLAANCNFEHPPLAKEILGVGLHLFGNTLTVGRVTASLFGLGTALFLYLFIRHVTDWRFGLVAAALWSLTPQAGVENNVATHALRISRFALLDPFLCFFFALALWAGWHLRQRATREWALVTGAALVAAALSKEIGLVLAPGIIILALANPWRRRGVRRTLPLFGWVLVGGAFAAVVAYLPLGWSQSVAEVRYLISFQFHHATQGSAGILHGHYYGVVPWWANIWYAFTGMGWIFFSLLAIAIVAALVRREMVVAYVLAPTVLIFLVTARSHLTYPFYWVDLEPGLVAAAALGVAWIWRHRAVRVPAAAALGTLGLLSVGLLVSGVASASPGPYQRAAHTIDCRRGCTVDYVGFLGVLENYVTGTVNIARPGGGEFIFQTPGSNVVVPFHSGAQVRQPEYVVIDPASPIAKYEFARSVSEFERRFSQIGYVEVPSGTRMRIWRLVR